MGAPSWGMSRARWETAAGGCDRTRARHRRASCGPAPDAPRRRRVRACRSPAYRAALQPQIAEPRVIQRARAGGVPAVEAVGLLDLKIIDAGVPELAAPLLVELPLLVAVRAVPQAVLAHGLRREPHGDAV